MNLTNVFGDSFLITGVSLEEYNQLSSFVEQNNLTDIVYYSSKFPSSHKGMVDVLIEQSVTCRDLDWDEEVVPLFELYFGRERIVSQVEFVR